MFLHRPQPLEGESLSSWRQRSGIANGFYLYPVWREPRRTDPDVARQDILLRLMQETAVPIDRLRQLTITHMADRIAVGEARRRGRWLVPLRYTHGAHRQGPSFCPACLASKKASYFRLNWRLAFTTECAEHRVKLLDHCPKCEAPAWPHTAAVAKLFVKRAIGLAECAYCGNDLGSGETLATSPETSAWLLAVLESGTANTGGHTFASHEFFEALWITCQLFVRNRVSERIQASGGDWRRAAIAATSSGVNQVEAMPIEIRRTLLSAAVGVLGEWPRSFLNFADACGLQHHHFADSASRPPAWMSKVVDEHLRVHSHRVTAAAVASAIAECRNAGVTPSRARIRIALGSSSASAIDLALPTRVEATDEELYVLLSTIDEVAQSRRRRMSSQLTRLRDCVLIGASILLNAGGRELGVMPMDVVVGRCRRVGRLSPAGERLQKLVVKWHEQLVAGTRQLWGIDGSAPFPSVRTGRCFSRSTAKLLTSGMVGLDEALRRDASVFRKPVRDADAGR